jgi:hypothetical protein
MSGSQRGVGQLWPAPTRQSTASDETIPVSEIAYTLRDPDQAAIDAAVKRTELLFSPAADFVALAVDAAVSVKADNSLEKMLAHQLALIDMLAMNTGARALEFEKRHAPLVARDSRKPIRTALFPSMDTSV